MSVCALKDADMADEVQHDGWLGQAGRRGLPAWKPKGGATQVRVGLTRPLHADRHRSRISP